MNKAAPEASKGEAIAVLLALFVIIIVVVYQMDVRGGDGNEGFSRGYIAPPYYPDSPMGARIP